VIFLNFLGENSEFWSAYSGGAVSGLIAIGIFVAVLFFLAFYIYFASAWSTIARKLKYKKIGWHGYQ